MWHDITGTGAASLRKGHLIKARRALSQTQEPGPRSWGDGWLWEQPGSPHTGVRSGESEERRGAPEATGQDAGRSTEATREELPPVRGEHCKWQARRRDLTDVHVNRLPLVVSEEKWGTGVPGKGL